LPVSGSSAELALSKMKIIKIVCGQLLSNDTMSALMIMVAESDLLRNISKADIIKRMAITSLSLHSTIALNQGNLRLRDGLAMDKGY